MLSVQQSNIRYRADKIDYLLSTPYLYSSCCCGLLLKGEIADYVADEFVVSRTVVADGF